MKGSNTSDCRMRGEKATCFTFLTGIAGVVSHTLKYNLQ